MEQAVKIRAISVFGRGSCAHAQALRYISGTALYVDRGRLAAALFTFHFSLSACSASTAPDIMSSLSSQPTRRSARREVVVRAVWILSRRPLTFYDRSSTPLAAGAQAILGVCP